MTLLDVIDGFQWFWIRSLHRNIQLAGVSQGFILGVTLFLLYIYDLLMMLSMLMILLYTLNMTGI